MSYIIKNNILIAKTEEYLKSGEEVRFSNVKSKDRASKDREYYLVNADYAKASNNKKWDKIYNESNLFTAQLIDSKGMYKEYLI